MPGLPPPQLTTEHIEALAADAQTLGLPRLAAVRLDHPGLKSAHEAIDRFVTQGKAGEMAFMHRTQEARKDPNKVLANARSAIVTIIPYDGEPGPVARYAQHQDYHFVLFRRLLALDTRLKATFPTIETEVCVDTKPIPERALAELSGLGTLGKNGCLIVPGLGSFVLIGVLLTNAEYVDTKAMPNKAMLNKAMLNKAGNVENHTYNKWNICGSCTACLDQCPTQAFDGPGDLDSRRCISYLTLEYRGDIEPDLAKNLGERIAGCDVCQEVCPHNHSPKRRERAPIEAWLPPLPDGKREVDLEHLAEIGSNPYKKFIKLTSLNRIPRRSLKRNAILAMAHQSQPLSQQQVELLTRARSDDEPTIKVAAEWVLTQRT